MCEPMVPPLPIVGADEQAIRIQRRQKAARAVLILGLAGLIFDLFGWLALLLFGVAGQRRQVCVQCRHKPLSFT